MDEDVMELSVPICQPSIPLSRPKKPQRRNPSFCRKCKRDKIQIWVLAFERKLGSWKNWSGRIHAEGTKEKAQRILGEYYVVVGTTLILTTLTEFPSFSPRKETTSALIRLKRQVQKLYLNLSLLHYKLTH
ncbi:hypothetical protein RHGRI_034443 [Rhododendron griersonianum]|uniref:Uncharacterized protein n=1 Tax=Rhododendron griersonianum TaxID=479676 RepID=A0AAV6I3G4_9ERIC|nr:hypothetical protein RHGRI_034443 [Rhododendron griersonianum]